MEVKTHGIFPCKQLTKFTEISKTFFFLSRCRIFRFKYWIFMQVELVKLAPFQLEGQYGSFLPENEELLARVGTKTQF